MSDPLSVAEEARERLRGIGMCDMCGFKIFNVDTMKMCLESYCLLLKSEIKNSAVLESINKKRLLVTNYYKAKLLLECDCSPSEIAEILGVNT